MKKSLLTLALLVSLISFSTALTAQIDPSSLEDIVLTEENNYSVLANYSSTQSSPSDEINSRNWVALDTADSELGTDSGLNAQFEATRGQDPTKTTNVLSTVRLIVNNGTDQDVDEVDVYQPTQRIFDEPNATISADQTDISPGDTVNFTSKVTNTLNNPVSYTWEVNGSETISGSSSSVEKTFDTEGVFDVRLNVSDAQNYSSTTENITVQVGSPGSTNPSSGPSGGSGGGGGGAAPPMNQQDKNQTSEEEINDTGKSDNQEGKKGVKSVVAESENGVASVEITKQEGVNEISVTVEPASDKTGVKNIRITSGESGEVSVSVRDIGREKPDEVSEEAGNEVYSYQEINTSINDSSIEAAEIDFSVNRTWVDERNRSVEDVVMKRQSNESWSEVPTRHVNSTEKVHNFEASSEGFSYYAVALQDSENQTTEEPDQEPGQTGINTQLYMVIAAVVLIAILGFFWMKRRNSNSSDFNSDFESQF